MKRLLRFLICGSLLLFVYSEVQGASLSCRDIFSASHARPINKAVFAIPEWVNDALLFAHLNAKRFPEAQRRAEELHLRDLSEKIEIYIVNSLMNDSIVGLPRYLRAGSTEVYVVTLSSGIKAIFKPDPQYWVMSSKKAYSFLSNSAAEAAAYILSRLLGFRLVPPTVTRVVDGKMGSLQVMVQGEHLKQDAFTDALNRTGALMTQALDLMAFDYLIRNVDRNEQNILIQERQMWAIDNGSSFHPMAVRLLPARLEDVPVDQLSLSFRSNLYATTPEIIRNALKEYPNQQVVEEIIERRQLLLNALENQEFSPSRR